MIQAIRPAQLADWLTHCRQEQPEGSAPPVVLDVREPWEFQAASVKADGFELIHMPMRAIPARYGELPRDRAIACLCHHGGRSAQVAYFLRNPGYDRVVNIHGGIQAWSQEVDPSVPPY